MCCSEEFDNVCFGFNFMCAFTEKSDGVCGVLQKRLIVCPLCFLQKGLMVCGIDSYHEGKGLRQASSVGAFVAATNTQCTRWFSRVCNQAAGQELMDCLVPCFLESLQVYHKVRPL